MANALISHISEHVGEEVTIRGWLYNKRSSGKIQFLILRDGSGFIQGVAVRGQVSDEVFELCGTLTQESSIIVTGTAQADSRSPYGYELSIRDIQLVQLAEEYPISLKEHGVDFLMDHRHLWLRTPRQVAVMRIRNEIIKGMRDWLDDHDFILMDAPILTPSACEGTTNLFETEYFGDKAYLSQSGQLYNEANAMALGRVYCFGPTFRAEKSKTRRHLLEFWMMEPEMAYCDQKENMEIQEQLVSYVVKRVLDKRRTELKMLERDIAKLETVVAPFPRLSYDDAIEHLKSKEVDTFWGNDLGAADETMLGDLFDRPVFITNYPAKAKAFYMKPDPNRPEVVLCSDLIAPEGYGEIIGSSQRIDDPNLLAKRIAEENLPEDAYGWYMDLRRYGTVPHSGFGIGIERTVSWICGLDHVRETIPFPRLLNRIYP